MSYFSSLSDSEDESEINSIISQAKDQIVLEQVAAIKCSGFTDSGLPTHLETRFQKLKSFPVYTPKSSSTPKIQSNSKPQFSLSSGSDSDSKSVKKNGLLFPDSEVNSVGNSVVNSVGKTEPIELKSVGDDVFSPVERNPERRRAKSLKSPYGSSSRWDSSTESNSPPQKSGCFWCSPKKSSKKKSGKESSFLGVGFDWEKDDELVADLKAFSVKGLSKKAMREEEKINREAEKIVEWAKQVSARIDVSGIEDELSDNEHFK